MTRTPLPPGKPERQQHLQFPALEGFGRTFAAEFRFPLGQGDKFLTEDIIGVLVKDEMKSRRNSALLLAS